MVAIILGILALGAFLVLSRIFVAADPARMAQRMRIAGGVGAIVLGGLLMAIGRGGFGLPLIVLGGGLLSVFFRRSVETDLNRGPSGRAEDLKGDTRARRGNPPRQGAMSEDEAYKILGLDPGTGPDEIRRAHRALMQKLHPDRGGSDWIASRINQAKDVLLRKRYCRFYTGHDTHPLSS